MLDLEIFDGAFLARAVMLRWPEVEIRDSWEPTSGSYIVI
jgi:hypothetical protein